MVAEVDYSNHSKPRPVGFQTESTRNSDLTVLENDKTLPQEAALAIPIVSPSLLPELPTCSSCAMA